MTSNSTTEMRALVRGNVQGVGFRVTTKRLALQLEITGTVENLDDGSVEIFAQGSHEQLNTLLSLLNETFGSRHITSIETSFYPPQQSYATFTLRR